MSFASEYLRATHGLVAALVVANIVWLVVDIGRSLHSQLTAIQRENGTRSTCLDKSIASKVRR
jgi:hypothetical protein